MDLAVFTHFQTVAVQYFGNIPLAKGDDDGSLVDAVIKESRFPVEQRQIKWETLKEVLEKFKVGTPYSPFSTVMNFWSARNIS